MSVRKKHGTSYKGVGVANSNNEVVNDYVPAASAGNCPSNQHQFGARPVRREKINGHKFDVFACEVSGCHGTWHVRA